MRNWMIGIAILFVLAIWQVGHLTYSVLHKKSEWEQKGIQLAKANTAIKQIDRVSLFHGEKSYIVVKGENQEGISMMAWFREDGLLDGFEYEKDLISREAIKDKLKKQAPKAAIIRLQPGMANRKPLWEVIFLDQDKKYNYYYYDMRSGEFVRSYKLQHVVG